MGNRIAKYVYNGSELESSTFYVRDAQGTTIAVYDEKLTTEELNGVNITTLKYALAERHIYGSSRLGMDTTEVVIPNSMSMTVVSTPETDGSRHLGKRLYELSNHLGNVLTVISYRKMAVPLAGTSEVWYYRPHLVSVTDYSPFGVALTARTWSDQEYRYGFQAQEQDNEMWEGSVTYKYRVEDPRLGRFFCVDPLVVFYSYNSPFSFSENRVIDCIELEGAELMRATESRLLVEYGVVKLQLKNFSAPFRENWDKQKTGRDRLGRLTIGASTELVAFGLLNSSSSRIEHPDLLKMPNYSYYLKAIPPSNFQQYGSSHYILNSLAPMGPEKFDEIVFLNASPAIARPQPGQRNWGGPDYALGGAPGMVAKNFARGALAVYILRQLDDLYSAMWIQYDRNKLSESFDMINVAFTVVQSAMKDGLVPSDLMNLNDVSALTQMIFDGTGPALYSVDNEGCVELNMHSVLLYSTFRAIVIKYDETLKQNGYTEE